MNHPYISVATMNYFGLIILAIIFFFKEKTEYFNRCTDKVVQWVKARWKDGLVKAASGSWTNSCNRTKKSDSGRFATLLSLKMAEGLIWWSLLYLLIICLVCNCYLNVVCKIAPTASLINYKRLTWHFWKCIFTLDVTPLDVHFEYS